MNWTALDTVHQYAKQRGIVFQYHTFLQSPEDEEPPAWLAALPPNEQAEEIEEWMRLFCERYPDVALVGVVGGTEPDDLPAYASALGGTGSSGYDWMIKAFELAHQSCPNATLLLNDWDSLENPKDNTRLIEVVNALKNAKAPLDAIGTIAQNLLETGPVDDVEWLLGNVASTGLPIYIVRMEVDATDESKQRADMMATFPIFWHHPSVKGITYWRYASPPAEGDVDSALIANDGRQRPALTWLMDYLDRP